MKAPHVLAALAVLGIGAGVAPTLLLAQSTPPSCLAPMGCNNACVSQGGNTLGAYWDYETNGQTWLQCNGSNDPVDSNKSCTSMGPPSQEVCGTVTPVTSTAVTGNPCDWGTPSGPPSNTYMDVYDASSPNSNCGED